MSGDPARIIVIDDWYGKYVINESYRPIAEALVKKYEELRHIQVKSVLFIDNTKGTGKTLNRRKYAQIGKIPERWQDLVYQMTGRVFMYFVEMFKRNIEHMSREQVVALIYHELRHIIPDGNMRHHDIEEWDNILTGLGTGWAAPNVSIPDLLEKDIGWNSIVSPRLFGEVRLKAVK